RLLRRRDAEIEPRAGGGRPANLFSVSLPEDRGGQYVAYRFYKVDPAWRRLPIEERNEMKEAFAEVVDDCAGRMDALKPYSVTGVRPDADFFFWQITQRYEDLGELGAALNATPLAGWLEVPYSYLATTMPSQYTSAWRARKVIPKNSPYLV